MRRYAAQGELAVALLGRMLVIDPAKRAEAKDCLDDAYFWEGARWGVWDGMWECMGGTGEVDGGVCCVYGVRFGGHRAVRAHAGPTG